MNRIAMRERFLETSNRILVWEPLAET
jgi:hypothetical protein